MSRIHPSSQAIFASLLFTIFLWGGNNTGIKFMAQSWPPIWIGCSRFLCAGLFLTALLRWTRWFGNCRAIDRQTKRDLWLKTGLSLAVYIVVFNWAMRFTSASHVVLYLGASPIWALALEGDFSLNPRNLVRAFCALIAFAGVALLLWPVLFTTDSQWIGELLGFGGSFLWAYHGNQCRSLSGRVGGVQLTAQTMWRAAVWLMPLAWLEVTMKPIHFSVALVGVQLYSILAGSVAAFALWNNALAHWPASRVLLFSNLVPLSTMAWASVCLGEKVSSTFFIAMVLIIGSVLLSQLGEMKFSRRP